MTYLKEIFLYIISLYFIWLGITALVSFVKPVHKANRKVWGYRAASILGGLLAIIAIYFHNIYFVIIALIQLILFYKICGGEPDLDPNKLEPNTNNLNAFINNGVDAAISGDYNKALEIFDEAIRIDPKNEAARAQKANVFNRLYKDNEAVTLCNQVLADNPNNKEALLYKGIALINLGFYKEALSIFDKLLAMDPNNKLYIRNRQRCL
jgi:tetratricopeptide (TPR) repeat protein